MALRPVRFALDGIVAVLLPSDCRICGDSLLHLGRIPVCKHCLDSLNPAHVNACGVCGEAFRLAPAGETPGQCGLCRRAHPHFDFAISFGAYDGALRRLVHLLKYEQLHPAAKILGAKLAEAVAGRNLAADKPVLVIPVPLHRTKHRQRGFNQSEALARRAICELDERKFELHADNLRRVRATVSQTGLTRHQRRENVRGAFVVRSSDQVRDRSVLLIDDVYTTGTTLNECARVLRRAGARQVIVATVARVYRTVMEIAPGGVPGQEGNAAVFAEAAAG